VIINGEKYSKTYKRMVRHLSCKMVPETKFGELGKGMTRFCSRHHRISKMFHFGRSENHKCPVSGISTSEEIDAQSTFSCSLTNARHLDVFYDIAYIDTGS
jgi:hypothetical protein